MFTIIIIIKYVPMKGVRRRSHKKGAPFPSTRINELHASDQYVGLNEKEQFLLVWFNNEMEGDQSVLVKSCVICFWDIHAIHVVRAQRYSYSDRRGLRSEKGMNSSEISPSRATIQTRIACDNSRQ